MRDIHGESVSKTFIVISFNLYAIPGKEMVYLRYMTSLHTTDRTLQSAAFPSIYVYIFMKAKGREGNCL